MSYILDALKRAESERSRGAVPNIHAQPDLGGEPDARGAVASRLGWGLVAVAVVVVSAAGWWWLSGDEPDRWKPTDAVAEVPVPALSTPPLLPPAEPAAPSVSNPPVTVVVAPTAPTAPPVRTAAAANPVPRSSPAVTANAGSLSVARPAAPPPAARVVKTEAAAVAGPASAAASQPPAAEERVYALKDLPDDIRSSLPALTVGGATYSENPANRMLIVNGQLFHEGDQLAPELTLQQIKLRSAVLNFRGYRYGISY